MQSRRTSVSQAARNCGVTSGGILKSSAAATVATTKPAQAKRERFALMTPSSFAYQLVHSLHNKGQIVQRTKSMVNWVNLNQIRSAPIL
jgi:hypothetical protein